MAKSNATEADVLKFLLRGEAPAYFSGTNVFFALHTQPLADNANASTNEASYPNYARVSYAKANFTLNANNEMENTQQILFPQAGTGANQTIRAISITTAATGASQILYYVNLANPIQVVENASVFIPVGGLKISED